MNLATPVDNGEEEITEITLREPLGEDIQKVGFPFLIIPGDGDESTIDLRPKVIAKYISLLGGIPPSVVGKLSAADFTDLMGEVMGFFGESPGVKVSLKI